jgi:hypothetical protein
VANGARSATARAYTGDTLKQGLFGDVEGGGSFYGPIRRGLLAARVAELARDKARAAGMDRAINVALAGSNLLRGATDQGSPTDPNAAWSGGRLMRQGEVYNDWGGGPGGHEGAAAFRELQHRAVRGQLDRAAIRGRDRQGAGREKRV